MAFEIGDTVGDYQIIGILGAGGMGKVYKVRNVISDRTEAMKVLLPNLAEAPELADRFIREIKLLASLSHPNIAGLHTAMRQENQLLMFMEFIEGRTLEERLKEGPVPVPEACNLISQVLSALAYAHERNVVHRDIKPANMMVTPQGEVKLMDFGIAKAMADRRLTMTGTTLGSLYYMSPEQVKGSTELDGRSDLYSVGISLYELVTGTRPFKGDSDYSIMVAHLEQQPVPPIQVDPTLPPALNEIILTAIQKDPANRFQTAQAFRGALSTVSQGVAAASARPAVAAPPPPPPMAPTRTVGAVPTPPAAAPPQSAAPPPAAYAEPPLFPPADAPSQSSGGHRGLYMVLGGLVVLALLAVAAIQLPSWYRTLAGGGSAQPAVEEQQPPLQPPADQTAQPPTDQPPPPVESMPAESTQPEPAAQQPAESGTGMPEITRPRRNPPERRVGKEPMEREIAPPPPQPMQTEQARPSEPAPPPVDTEALERARERLGMLAARANAVRGTLQNLEEQQRSMGVGLRGDISASWKRMEYLLDEAEAALKRQDLAAARRNLNLAERETDKLEKFLGR